MHFIPALFCTGVNTAAVSSRKLPDTYNVQLQEPNSDCIASVRKYLASKGVSLTSFNARLNQKIGDAGSICSFSNTNSGIISSMPKAIVTSVSTVSSSRSKVPVAPKINQPRAASAIQKRQVAQLATDDLFNKDVTLVTSPFVTDSRIISSFNYSSFKPNDYLSILGVDKARSEFGLTGKGIKVAVIDSGIYYKHPALGGGFGPGFKVAYGYDLVGDTYSFENQTMIPDPDPLENCSTQSHGTHVSGLIAARAQPNLPFQFSGIAPDVTLGMYRVFGCSEDFTTSDVVAAAIYMAVNAGSNIINLSIGQAPLTDDPLSDAIKYAASKNTIVVAAVGNDGQAGAYSASYSSNVDQALAVTSFESDTKFATQFIINGKAYPCILGHLKPVADNAIIEKYALNYNSTSLVETDFVDGDGLYGINPDCKGKACLIRHGSKGGSIERCDAAAKAGATSCIIYNANEEKLIRIYGSTKIPSVMIGQYALVELEQLKLAGKSPQIQVRHMFTAFDNYPRSVSPFSSMGLDVDLELKPDLGGLGSFMFSTISANAQQSLKAEHPYVIWSGTSMAAPTVSGCLALLLQRFGTNTPIETIRARLMNNANGQTSFYYQPLPNGEYEPYAESTARQGAGLINIYKSLTATTVVTPSKISLMDEVRGKLTQPLKICNQGTTATIYTVRNIDAVSYNPFPDDDDAFKTYINMIWEFSKTKFITRSVKIYPKSCATLTISFGRPSGAPYTIYSGLVRITSTLGEEITVPYAGTLGNWKNSPVISTKSPSLKSWLELKTQKSLPRFNGSGIYSHDNTFSALVTNQRLNANLNIPILLAATQSSKYAEISVQYVGTGAIFPTGIDGKNLPLPYLYDEDGADFGSFSQQLVRNSIRQLQFISEPTIFKWAGEVDVAGRPVKLPRGKYQITIRALRPFGDLKNPADYQSIVSPTFELFY